LQYRLGTLPRRKRRLPSLPIALDIGLPTPGADTLNDAAERDLARLFFTRGAEFHDLKAPEVDPERTDSAVEGVSL
jgi:hypothetical protein